MQLSNIILFDEENTHSQLLPLTFTRPIADIRIGILTIKEKWEKLIGVETSYLTIDYLQDKYPCTIEAENVLINAALIPTKALVTAIDNLLLGESLHQNNRLLAVKLPRDLTKGFNAANFNLNNGKKFDDALQWVNNAWDIFTANAAAIQADFKLITAERKSAGVDDNTVGINPDNIFVEEGAKISGAILNATDGPIYIGKDAEIMEGSLVRGPFALCNNSTLKMGAKIYGATTIGPHSKVGGEVSNSIIFGYSNKAHDGFLGNSVIGEWCNLGADSNNSNLKNNYADVKLWNYTTASFTNTGQQFCGLIMGDHSKCGINTMFNTGTVVGVSANIFGSGFPRNFIPSYSWGGASGFTTYKLDKVFETAKLVMSRRNIKLTEADKAILTHIFDLTEKFRR